VRLESAFFGFSNRQSPRVSSHAQQIPSIKDGDPNVVRFSLEKKNLNFIFLAIFYNIGEFVTKHSILMFKAEILPQKNHPK
jgi:ABC-type transport system substrate-binding protein